MLNSNERWAITAAYNGALQDRWEALVQKYPFGTEPDAETLLTELLLTQTQKVEQ